MTFSHFAVYALGRVLGGKANSDLKPNWISVWFISPMTWLTSTSAIDSCVFDRIIMITVKDNIINVVITVDFLVCYFVPVWWCYDQSVTTLLCSESTQGWHKTEHSNHHNLMVSHRFNFSLEPWIKTVKLENFWLYILTGANVWTMQGPDSYRLCIWGVMQYQPFIAQMQNICHTRLPGPGAHP